MFLIDQELNKGLPTCKMYSALTMSNQGLYFICDLHQ